MSGRARVLVVCPTSWDERQLAALSAEARARHELVFDELADDDVRWDLDVAAYVDERVRRWRGRIDGVLTSSDYPGAIAAAAIAAELGLPGPRPESVLRASHKYYARLAQREVVPEVVPRFALFDPADERTWPSDEAFPCFAKPVKGSFSLFARRIEDRRALRAFAASPALAEFRAYYVRLFDEFAARYTRFEHGARAFLAEELVGGAQVTVEGWVQGGRAHVLGIVDTSFHPGTRSFASFDYPSVLSPEVQERMGNAACAVALALGLDHTLFNVELFYDREQDRIALIELNPRLCGQFADLYEKVDGTSGFEVALALACGHETRVRRAAGRFRAAASRPLRLFRAARVLRAPGAAELRAAEAARPGTLVWSEVRAGDELRVAADVEDGESVRYGILNLGGSDRSDILRTAAGIARSRPFAFHPAEAATAPSLG
jgi:biotin carboxylase